MQSEHLGDLGRGIAPHDIALYLFCGNVSSTNLRKLGDFRQIFCAFSSDLREVKHRYDSLALNLGVVPHHVKGFVLGERNFDKHALRLTDFENLRFGANFFLFKNGLTSGQKDSSPRRRDSRTRGASS
jgi:hypothetical protein